MEINNSILCHKSNYTEGRSSSSVEYIVIHYTANNGDTARNNCVYFSGASRGASAHYFVGDDGVYQSVMDEDTAWHCGGTTVYKHPYCRNRNSIGIEMCSRKNENGEYYIKDNIVDLAVTLTKQLITKYGISADNVIRHYDVWNKQCPEPFVREPQFWADFKSRLEDDAVTREEYDALVRKVNAIDESLSNLYNIADSVVERLMNLENAPVYNYIDDNMPEWARDAVQAAVDKEIILGEGDGLGLTYADLRSIVREYRAGLYS